MDFLQVKGKTKFFLLFFLLLHFGVYVNGYSSVYLSDRVDDSSWSLNIVNLNNERVRRDAAPEVPSQDVPAAPVPPAGPAAAPASAPAPAPAAAAAGVPAPAATNISSISNASPNDKATTLPPAVVTKIPLLGVNGSGIRKVNLTSEPKVSDPILPNDDYNITEMFKETPEQINQTMAQHNLTDLRYDTHSFYNSTFIGNKTYFDEYWANITAGEAEVHPVLSDSHRRATTLTLGFMFPFYGHPLRNVTVATGGFIYTGEHVHNWLAATQYIAPLMANFDTTGDDNSVVKVIYRDDHFTALWENVALQEDRSKEFTFAVTMYKNGDIVFAYKNVPIPIASINEYEHPVKVGISDAYQTDRVLFYVRRKTIYEYHRVTFKDYNITSNTILKLVALPTCLQYNTCSGCVNHETGFNCTWCEQLNRCSSGTDRNRQDWLVRNCDRNPIIAESSCPANSTAVNERSTAYITDENHPFHDAVIRTDHGDPKPRKNVDSVVPLPSNNQLVTEARFSIGGVIAAFLSIALFTTLIGWFVYAFKYPHTRSGQMLIKYRPSQWSWKRGEARYTAATIHM